MNKLFLIGNGFDLAHGLKTKYSDFMLWYINKSARSYIPAQSNTFNDELIRIIGDGYKISEFNSLKSFNEVLGRRNITFEGKHTFLKKLLKQISDSNWVDIEYEYYFDLLDIYKRKVMQNTSRSYDYEEEVRELNICLELIKTKLMEYLQTIKMPVYNDQISNRFKDESEKRNFNEVLFLVFNYTKTIELYTKSVKAKNVQVIYIHGQLEDNQNPIIFGYGDEMDEYYGRIENLNRNEFLNNMKSFSYLKTHNYQALSRFINSSNYTVSIMGHSCGISDRVLLNSIFCNQLCRGIRIYYYQKNENENDYFEKTQEISRHFPLNLKDRMRNMIVPLSESLSL
jgi:hypothetical protein